MAYLDGTGLGRVWGKIKTALNAKQNTINSTNKLNPDYITNTGDINYLPSRIDKTTWNAKLGGMYEHNVTIQCACAQWQIRFSFISKNSTSYSSNYSGLYSLLHDTFGSDEIYCGGFFVNGSQYYNIGYLLASDTSANKYLYAYIANDSHVLQQIGYASVGATSVTDVVKTL